MLETHFTNASEFVLETHGLFATLKIKGDL